MLSDIINVNKRPISPTEMGHEEYNFSFSLILFNQSPMFITYFLEKLLFHLGFYLCMCAC